MSDPQLSRPAPVPEQALVVIGDITISKSWLVTPVGSRPLAGTQIFVTDFSRTETKVPTWAVALAILGAFVFLLGLLFLLARETVTIGSLQVSVQKDDLVYATQIPALNAQVAEDVHARVHFARQLVGAASAG